MNADFAVSATANAVPDVNNAVAVLSIAAEEYSNAGTSVQESSAANGTFVQDVEFRCWQTAATTAAGAVARAAATGTEGLDITFGIMCCSS